MTGESESASFEQRRLQTRVIAVIHELGAAMEAVQQLAQIGIPRRQIFVAMFNSAAEREFAARTGTSSVSTQLGGPPASGAEVLLSEWDQPFRPGQSYIRELRASLEAQMRSGALILEVAVEEAAEQGEGGSEVEGEGEVENEDEDEGRGTGSQRVFHMLRAYSLPGGTIIKPPPPGPQGSLIR